MFPSQKIRVVVVPMLGDSRSILCWKDRWVWQVFAKIMPELTLTYLKNLKNVEYVVQIAQFFSLPLYPQTYSELIDLHNILENTTWSDNSQDFWLLASLIMDLILFLVIISSCLVACISILFFL